MADEGIQDASLAEKGPPSSPMDTGENEGSDPVGRGVLAPDPTLSMSELAAVASKPANFTATGKSPSFADWIRHVTNYFRAVGLPEHLWAALVLTMLGPKPLTSLQAELGDDTATYEWAAILSVLGRGQYAAEQFTPLQLQDQLASCVQPTSRWDTIAHVRHMDEIFAKFSPGQITDTTKIWFLLRSLGPGWFAQVGTDMHGAQWTDYSLLRDRIFHLALHHDAQENTKRSKAAVTPSQGTLAKKARWASPQGGPTSSRLPSARPPPSSGDPRRPSKEVRLDRRGRHECEMCGAPNFTPAHIAVCPARQAKRSAPSAS